MNCSHLLLRKQYYTAFDVPFCKCGGCWHYDKDLRGFVCEECGRPVPVIDITRHTRPLDVCKLCGAPITQAKKGRKREFCSDYCRQKYKNYYKANLVINPQRNIPENDKIQYGKDLEIFGNAKNNNDEYWGLGESNLTEHRAEDDYKEWLYVKQEKERLLRKNEKR